MTEQATANAIATPARIALHEPEISGNEWTYVKECLDTAWVSSVGSFVDRFEAGVAATSSTRFGVAASSGTAALHISLMVSGVAANDEVLVSSMTFIAPANAVRYVGAWPVFIDAEPSFWQMDPQKIAAFLADNCERRGSEVFNKSTGRRVKAILTVDVLGHPVDFDPIRKLADEYGLVVIEDSTESLGSTYKGRPAGSLGDIAVFSFNGNKIITTGGGGMIVTDNQEWARRAKYLTTQAKDDPIEYIHNEVGYNYRLTNLQAAMGCAQLEQLPRFVEKKRQIAARYDAGLKNAAGITTMPHAPWADATFWLYTILIDSSKAGLTSREMMRKLDASGIQTRPLWQPLHQSPAYRNCEQRDCPVADVLYRDALSLPSSVGLSEESQERVISSIIQLVGDGR